MIHQNRGKVFIIFDGLFSPNWHADLPPSLATTGRMGGRLSRFIERYDSVCLIDDRHAELSGRFHIAFFEPGLPHMFYHSGPPTHALAFPLRARCAAVVVLSTFGELLYYWRLGLGWARSGSYPHHASGNSLGVASLTRSLFAGKKSFRRAAPPACCPSRSKSTPGFSSASPPWGGRLLVPMADR